MKTLVLFAATLGCLFAFAGLLKWALLPAALALGDFGGLFLLAFTLGGIVAAWWFLCWLGFRLGIR